MKRRTRINYTQEQKAIIQDRYHSSVMPTVLLTGRYLPPVRKRHRLAFSLDEREEISRGLPEKSSIRKIADKLSRTLLTVSREKKRPGSANINVQ